MGYQTWIADKCREFGLDVIEVDGWRTRGNPSFNPAGVVTHHTAGASSGEMPSLGILIRGRADLAGPLCNVGLSRSGRVFVVAAGRANHAGAGGWRGLVGNSSVLGIEAENDGRQGWPAEQYAAYIRLAAALTDGASRNVGLVCGHKEWAPTRKIDPHTIDMEGFRTAVSRAVPKKKGGSSHVATTPPIPHPKSGFALIDLRKGPNYGAVYNYRDHRGGAPPYLGGMNLLWKKELRARVPNVPISGGYFTPAGDLVITYEDGAFYVMSHDGRDSRPPKK